MNGTVDGAVSVFAVASGAHHGGREGGLQSGQGALPGIPQARQRRSLQGGINRNYQVFEPLDFLAELTQHIPNKGEHLIRYYGCYSNKARGRGPQAPHTHRPPASPMATAETPTPAPPPLSPAERLLRRRWAMLIQRVYQVDPLTCPKCGGRMKIIAFIEAHQDAVIATHSAALWAMASPAASPAAPRPRLLGCRLR